MSIRTWIQKIAAEVVDDAWHPITADLGDAKLALERVTELERKVERELSRLENLTEVIDARIEKGNQIWRQIRARERREEIQAEEEEWDDEVSGGNAGGGNGQGMLPLHGHMEPPPREVPLHIRVAEDLARRIAGGG